MPTLASSLLEFIMNLLRDPRAADEFNADPDAALANAGLSNVCSDDVDAIMPVILDYAPVGSGSSFDREYNTGGNYGGDTGNWSSDNDGWGGGRGRDDDDRDGWGRGRDDDDDRGGRGRDDDDHDHAVQQLTHIVNNYSYTSSIDDRDTTIDQSVNQNIWADGDVTQWFDNDAVVASGDDSIAAGDDADVDNSTGDENNHSVNLTTGDVGGGIAIGNTDNSIEDSYNEDHSTNDDHSIEDSYNKDL
ncbi:IniB N-terminal domain-containing protein, partial [Arthrobacter sp.]|uniref:IniB N-terminal domain-containing protein n=1 Tax=Arthrobacter sp. TaxID=1667 RepID=UPI003397A10A